MITASEVIDFFNERAGGGLAAGHRLEAPHDFRIQSLEPSAQLTQQYGAFVLGVFPDLAAIHRFWGTQPDPDERGIVWREQFPLREHEPPYWSAAKLYGNVQAIWWSPTPAIDERWSRLDALLTTMVRDLA